MTCPGSVELKDLRGDIHQLHVNVLGTEETWNTPSLILATDTHSNGVAVFSQVNKLFSDHSTSAKLYHRFTFIAGPFGS